jgi:hypothetical protein
MPWVKFTGHFRHQVEPGSDRVVLFFDPGEHKLVTTAVAEAAVAQGKGTIDPPPEEAFEQQKEKQRGNDYKSQPNLRQTQKDRTKR